MRNATIVFPAKGEVILEDRPIPAVAEGMLLVRTLKTLISTGTESICFLSKFTPDTHWANWVKYPFQPGYSQVGIVEEIGAGVTGFEVGELVATETQHQAWANIWPPSAIKVPEGVTPTDATWHSLGRIAQVGVRKADHELGDAVVIIGLGLLGQLVTQYVRLMGARQVIAIDTSDFRLELAKEHGATHCLLMPVQDAKDTVLELTGGRGVDVAYDITGAWQVLPHALPLVCRHGKVLILGDTGHPEKQVLTGDVVCRGVSIIGAHAVLPSFEVTDKEYWSRGNIESLFLEYIRRGDMVVEDLVTHIFSPADCAEAYGALEEQRETMMGVVFDWEADL